MPHTTRNGQDLDLDEECRDCGYPIVDGVCSLDASHEG